MNPDTILRQLEMCHYVVKKNVGEITHEQSLLQPAPAGNCLNWVLGHLVATRSNLLLGLGAEPVWGDADRKRYDRHGPPIRAAGEAKRLEEIWEAYDMSQQRLRQALSEITPTRLAGPAPFSPTNRPDETLGSLLESFAFHDAYHTGQTGVLRRLVGMPPADL
jgi:hypothetical protein